MKNKTLKNKTLRNKTLLCTTALALCLGAGAAQAQSNACNDISYRLWQAGTNTWFNYNEPVVIKPGTEGHLYVQVEGQKGNPYKTRATIGYPGDFGFSGRARDVVRHVRMSAQNAEDRAEGRIRFFAEQPGTVDLGYRLDGVHPPGELRTVARRCQVDRVRIQVGRGAGQRGDRRGDRPSERPAERPSGTRLSDREAAADDLVRLLYRGILRRERAGNIEPSFVDQVLNRGLDGLGMVAETMTLSEEFRYQALERTEAEHGKGHDLADLRDLLLTDIYRSLYGYVEPSRRDREEDLRYLDGCLSGSRRSAEACGRLGNSLLRSGLFYERHQEKIDYVRRGPYSRR